MKRSRILFVSIFACMLMVSLASMTATAPSANLSALKESQSAPAQDSDFNRIGAIEGIVTQIDPEGGVRNAVGTFLNASYYGIAYTAPYQAAVEGQMATATGYVSASQLRVAGRSVYPTGRIGGAFAMLTILVNPLVVLPVNPAGLYLSEPTLEEAHELADEIVALYETDILIDFERLATFKQYSSVFFDYEGMYSISQSTNLFVIQYVSFPDESSGNTAMTAMRTRLSGLGGFMDILDGTQWPVERTDFAETLMFDHLSEESSYYFGSGYLNPMNMYLSSFMAYVRADASHTSYVEEVHTGVLAMGGFDTPGYINDGAGSETYSLKQHVGYTGDIESKMFQDLTINSISSVVATAPTSLDISGVATDWDHVYKDFSFNSSSDIYLPTGQIVPGDATADEIIQAMIVSYPYVYALNLNQSISYMDPAMFDMLLDSLWASAGPFPDMREYFLEMDWSMVFTGFPMEEINQDALRKLMEQAGITPDTLMDEVNVTLIEENPMQALVEALIKCFDNYHLLDILQNTTYSNPYVIEGFLNEYITNIDTFIANFTGVDLPSSYATKEAFAALIEDHFGLVLQGLWDAMADFSGDTTNIKTAVQAMIDPAHLSEETTPYLIADLYSSAVSEYDYNMYVNFELPDMSSPDPWDPALLWLTTDDIILTFDLNISSLSFEGPHCIIRKTAPQRMTLGNNFTVTIDVENIGDATAYDLKILDGITAGFNTDKQYYWNKATLTAGATWSVTCIYTPETIGSYVEIPAILCYFNTTLASFDSGDMENWNGAAMYTISAVGSDRLVAIEEWWEGDILGIPTVIIIAGGLGAAIIALVVIVKKRK